MTWSNKVRNSKSDIRYELEMTCGNPRPKVISRAALATPAAKNVEGASTERLELKS